MSDTAPLPRRIGTAPALRLLIRAAGLVLTLAITFLGLLAITFVIGRVIPIDPILAILGERAAAE